MGRKPHYDSAAINTDAIDDLSRQLKTSPERFVEQLGALIRQRGDVQAIADDLGLSREHVYRMLQPGAKKKPDIVQITRILRSVDVSVDIRPGADARQSACKKNVKIWPDSPNQAYAPEVTLLLSEAKRQIIDGDFTKAEASYLEIERSQLETPWECKLNKASCLALLEKYDAARTAYLGVASEFLFNKHAVAIANYNLGDLVALANPGENADALIRERITCYSHAVTYLPDFNDALAALCLCSITLSDDGAAQATQCLVQSAERPGFNLNEFFTLLEEMFDTLTSVTPPVARRYCSWVHRHAPR